MKRNTIPHRGAASQRHAHFSWWSPQTPPSVLLNATFTWRSRCLGTSAILPWSSPWRLVIGSCPCRLYYVALKTALDGNHFTGRPLHGPGTNGEVPCKRIELQYFRPLLPVAIEFCKLPILWNHPSAPFILSRLLFIRNRIYSTESACYTFRGIGSKNLRLKSVLPRVEKELYTKTLLKIRCNTRLYSLDEHPKGVNPKTSKKSKIVSFILFWKGATNSLFH
jgi:hypothetical protein